jgi:septal ring factor EnvC (AmiA/AmiB activator)
VLEKPEIVLSQLADTGNADTLDTINAEIKNLEKKVRSYEQRRANLLQAIEWDEFTKDEILDRLNNLRRQRLEDETKLNDLLNTSV